MAKKDGNSFPLGQIPEACFGSVAGGTTAVSSVDSNGPDSAGPSKCLGACPEVLYFEGMMV